MSRREHFALAFDRNGKRIVTPGEMLVRELKRREMTQKELCALCGHSEKFISRLACGKIKLPIETALEFEEILGVPAEKWLEADLRYQLALAREERA